MDTEVCLQGLSPQRWARLTAGTASVHSLGSSCSQISVGPLATVSEEGKSYQRGPLPDKSLLGSSQEHHLSAGCLPCPSSAETSLLFRLCSPSGRPRGN